MGVPLTIPLDNGTCRLGWDVCTPYLPGGVPAASQVTTKLREAAASLFWLGHERQRAVDRRFTGAAHDRDS